MEGLRGRVEPPEPFKRVVRETQVVVMAAGRAKRMGMVGLPKALIPVAGKPMIDRCLEMIASTGFKRVLLVLGYKWERIAEHVGDGSRYGLTVDRVVIDIDVCPGKGQTLLKLMELEAIGRRRVLIVYPDDILTSSSFLTGFLLAHHAAREKLGVWGSVMVVNAVKLPYGVVRMGRDGLAAAFVEKPVLHLLASTGYYILEPRALSMAKRVVPRDPHVAAEFESYLLPRLAEKGKLYVHIVPEWAWLPVNTWKDLEEAEKALSDGEAG
ncbi:MAG: sugar phosphate nucleotidyltransferase [Thermofilaceae archaeon]